MELNVATTDVLLRGAAVAVLLLLFFVFVPQARSKDRRLMALSIVGVALGLIGYVLVSSPNLRLDEGVLGRLLHGLAAAVPVLVYVMGVLFFADKSRLQRWQVAMCAIVLLASWLAPLGGGIGLARGILVLVLYAHLLWVAGATAASDLLEWRRKFRVGFLAVIALIGGAISLIEIAGLDTKLPPIFYPLHAALLALVGAVFLLFSLRTAADIWPTQTADLASQNDLPSSHKAVLERLQTAMTNDIWREEGLTIGKLAARLETSEHRLRRSINKGLGYRNFSSFLNEQRVAAAKMVLEDSAQADMPILTLAYDLGYGSVGPFNRAFREATGESPTEYRRQQTALKA